MIQALEGMGAHGPRSVGVALELKWAVMRLRAGQPILGGGALELELLRLAPQAQARGGLAVHSDGRKSDCRSTVGAVKNKPHSKKSRRMTVDVYRPS